MHIFPAIHSIPRRQTICLIACVWAAFSHGLLAAQDGQAPIRDSQRLIQLNGRSWKSYRDQFVVKQERDYSCGAAALATITRYYWGDDSSELRYLKIIEATLSQEELTDRVENGLSMTDLRKAAVKDGYQASIGKLKLEKLHEVKIPVIVAIRAGKIDHFVVLRGIVNDQVYLSDPILGNRRMPVDVFGDVWIETALLAVVKKGKTKSDVSRLGITQREIDTGWLRPQNARTASPRFGR